MCDFHQVSTDEVYGDLPLDRPDLLFTEDTPIHTSSPYSASKASADLLVLAYHRTFGLPVTISRCSNNYGPYHFPEKLIPLMITNALNDQPLPVYGKGENVRDWLYVEDHCKAIDLIVRKGRIGEVYNIGGHNEMRNIDIVKLICKALDKPESLITYVTDRKGHDMRYAIDPHEDPQGTGLAAGKPGLRTACKKPSSGTWIMRTGGRRYEAANTRTTTKPCTATDEDEDERTCDRCQGAAGQRCDA